MPSTLKRILVVDDDEGIRNSLARILRGRGHQVTVAKDGFEALELVQSDCPDLLLVDIQMPGMDGVETFRRLREQAPSLVAIFMTAYADLEQTIEATNCGAHSVMPKPIDVERLLNKTSNLGSHT